MANFRRAPVTPTEAPDEEDDKQDREEEEEEFLTSPKNNTGSQEETEETSVLHYSLRSLHQEMPGRSSDLISDTASRLAVIDVTGSNKISPQGISVPDSPVSQQHQQYTQTFSATGTAALNEQAHLNQRPGALVPQVDEFQLEQDSFEPLNIAFQGSFPSLDALDMDSIDGGNWFQLDMESSLQARQAFNHFF
jgi:hypothetical protein